MPDFYIHRKLHQGEELIQDDDLLKASGVVVVLAEPGAGKSDLMNYFAERHGVPCELASLFVHGTSSSRPTLIIDALDEVARISEDKINEIIVKARNSGAKTVIVASRSYIWDEARTKIVRACFGIEPAILRLEPFDQDEQRRLFNYYVPGEDFNAFSSETRRLELTPILGNPQFLKLFADAYVEGGRRFSSKRQIYADALRRLASDSQTTGGLGDRPRTESILDTANEIFAKLLLPGSTGVSAKEEIGDDLYPFLRTVGPDDSIVIFALNTRLFKPTSAVNRHEPIHRIVAEYCAANDLVKRIQDPTNTFSIRRCLAIVAPNGAVRNELRGLLGWMASIGGRAIQEAVIDLDPYAVFANGDASQLLPSSKQKLLRGLEGLSKTDPFFRRMDSWRRFNVAGFFSADMTEHVRPLLTATHNKSHLRSLLLELLQGTHTAADLQQELRDIMRDPKAEMDERVYAYRDLNAIPQCNLNADFDFLVAQASRDSLEIASSMILDRGLTQFGATRGSQLTNALAQLYPIDGVRRRTGGSLYFIGQLLSSLSIDETCHLLEQITGSLHCICGKEKYECACLKGHSKIAGRLLDRYFELTVGPHDPKQIRRWAERLVFSRSVKADRSASVQALVENTGLRRAIQVAAFEGLSTQAEISEASNQFYLGHGHSGLHLYEGDYQNIVDHAAATGSHILWENFIVRHSPYRTPKGPDALRAYMRNQARDSSDRLRIWTRSERQHREQARLHYVRFGRTHKNYERREAKQKQKRLEEFRKHRTAVDAGRHWGWLNIFANSYLHKLEGIEDVVDDPQIVESSLLNSFDFLAAAVPSLETLANNKGGAIAEVLQAAGLAKFRKEGSLEGIAPDILQAIKASGIGGSGYEEGEAERFEAELGFVLNRDSI